MSIPSLTLNNGKQMPIFGLGTWQSPPGEVAQAVKDAIELGYRHIDCAHCYGNETEVGEGINVMIKKGVVKREDLFITSKLWNSKHTPSDVVPSIRNTLAALGLEYLDLYLIHWPMDYKPGDDLFPKDANGMFLPGNTDYVDTWKEMEHCVELGLTKSIGVSNFNSDQITRILGMCSIKPVMNQVEVHPYLSQRKLENFCKSKSIHLTAYSPLGSPNRPWAKPGDPKLLDEPTLKAIGRRHGKTAAQVVLRWVVQRGMVAIPKTVNKARLIENMDIFDFNLKEEDMLEIFSLEKEAGSGRGCAELEAKNHKYYPFNSEF